MKVEWTTPALNDLKSIMDFVRQDDPSAALRLAGRLFEDVESLTTMPNRGRLGVVQGTRELVFAPLPYIAVYSVFTETVRVLRVRHTSRKWP